MMLFLLVFFLVMSLCCLILALGLAATAALSDDALEVMERW